MNKDNQKPNVIIMYADDLGFGDIGAYGACEIPTPNLDKMAAMGLKFYDAHSTSAVCTPSRYSLLTGEYPFRNNKAQILPGDAGCVINREQKTLPKIFKEAGYNTGIVGKWHLGLGDSKVNWNEPISFTPLDTGFDESYILPTTADRVPCVYIDGRNVENLDKNDPLEVFYGKEEDCPFIKEINTYHKNPDMLNTKSSHGHDNSIINNIGRIGFMKGGESAIWKDEDLGVRFVEKANEFIEKNKKNPFFLYYALNQPHVPRVPNKNFEGITKLGPRGDVIAEMDWCIGQVVNKLEACNLLENTLIIFSSDNGPVIDDGYCDEAQSMLGSHKPAGPLRGGKYTKFEGGTRVPMIAMWKNQINPGTSNALIGHNDFLASFASMLDVKLKNEDAKDSNNYISAILGKNEIGRSEMLLQGGVYGNIIRSGKWAYLPPCNGRKMTATNKVYLGNSLDKRLYNLDYDIKEQDNVAQYYPEITQELQNRFEEILKSKNTRLIN